MVIFQCAKIMLFCEIEKSFDKKTPSLFFFYIILICYAEIAMCSSMMLKRSGLDEIVAVGRIFLSDGFSIKRIMLTFA